MNRSTKAACLVLLLSLAGPACIFHRDHFANRVTPPDWPEFTESVKKYTALVDGVAKGLPSLPEKATPEQIAAQQKAIASGVRSARSTARQGDIFPPSLAPQFVKIVRSETKGAAGKSARQTIHEDNPNAVGPVPVKLAVNAVYPDGAPLSTVPPAMLLRLPALPKTVEYRFVGKALVLHDVRADTIADWIPNALP